MVRAGSAVRIPHFLLTLIRQRFSQVLACPRHMLFHGQGGSFWVAFLYGNKDRQGSSNRFDEETTERNPIRSANSTISRSHGQKGR
jgi:hypothetical protein